VADVEVTIEASKIQFVVSKRRLDDTAYRNEWHVISYGGIVNVSGDGGFPMAMNGLITACEEKIPITTVIFNNSRLGWVSSGLGENKISSEFADINYADIAKTMGCLGYRIEGHGELETPPKETEDSDVPVVIDVITSTKFAFRDVSSRF